MNHPHEMLGHEMLETVKIVTPDGFAIINKSDLLPKHVLYDAEKPQSKPQLEIVSRGGRPSKKE